MDAQVLPNGRVLVAEAVSRTVREFDLKGEIKWEKKLDVEPNGCRRLANGNTLVSTVDRVMEFASDGSEVYSFKHGMGVKGSNAIRKYRNDHVLVATDGDISEMDTAGKHVRAIELPLPSTLVDVQTLPGDRFLAADSRNGKVLEVDAAGKVLWEAKVPGVCGVARTPGGGTLATTNHKVIELNREGQVVWEKATDGYPRRVYRR
jgi:hypothetical protein